MTNLPPKWSARDSIPILWAAYDGAHGYVGNLTEKRLAMMGVEKGPFQKVPPIDLKRKPEADAIPAHLNGHGMAGVERDLMVSTIEHYGGCHTKAMERLGMRRANYFRKLKHHGIKFKRSMVVQVISAMLFAACALAQPPLPAAVAPPATIPITLLWAKSPTIAIDGYKNGVDAYEVYWGGASGVYTNHIVALTNMVTLNLPPALKYFSVVKSAVRTNNPSFLTLALYDSNEAVWPKPAVTITTVVGYRKPMFGLRTNIMLIVFTNDMTKPMEVFGYDISKETK